MSNIVCSNRFKWFLISFRIIVIVWCRWQGWPFLSILRCCKLYGFIYLLNWYFTLLLKSVLITASFHSSYISLSDLLTWLHIHVPSSQVDLDQLGPVLSCSVCVCVFVYVCVCVCVYVCVSIHVIIQYLERLLLF